MKIAVFEVEPWERTAFERLGDKWDLHYTEQPLRAANVAEYAEVEVISTFIYSRLTADVLRQLPKLKLIATRSTGVDHVDQEYCREHDITVCNVPVYGEKTVAEHVFALLLTISHNMYAAIDRTRKGDFSLVGLRGFDLVGKTMGVIGTGDIGRNVIRIARGFSMEVLAQDLRPDEAFAREAGFRYVGLDELLAGSDIITLHVPATPKTRHLIGDDEFSRMKNGAVLINTARGNVVEVRAMMRALASGKLAAAGLDVLPEEPTIREEAELLHRMFQKEHDLETLLADHVLLRLRNVFITPHSAFCTNEAVQRILDTTIQNIERFEKGDPQNVAVGPPVEQ